MWAKKWVFQIFLLNSDINYRFKFFKNCGSRPNHLIYEDPKLDAKEYIFIADYECKASCKSDPEIKVDY